MKYTETGRIESSRRMRAWSPLAFSPNAARIAVTNDKKVRVVTRAWRVLREVALKRPANPNQVVVDVELD